MTSRNSANGAAFDCVRIEGEGDVLVVALDRPDDDLNRVDAAMHTELTRLFCELRSGCEARAILLTGVGRAFSAGGDLAWFPSLQEPGAVPAVHTEAKTLIWDLLDIPVPVVCALNGHAIGLGASIALLCDAVFMAASATIADPHVRVGLVAGDGGTVAWPSAIGPMAAKRYLLTGDSVTAVEAEKLGLITEAVPDDEVYGRALAFTQRLAAGAPLAVRYTKQAINQTMKLLLANILLDLSTSVEMITIRSSDHLEALDAIRQKREPMFTGT